MFLLQIIALLQAADPGPPYYTAQEKWRCEFKAFSGEDNVVVFFGIYRTHVEDDFGSDYAITQNDESAAVFAQSDYGNTDIEGKTRRWVIINLIDKRLRKFKRTVVDMEQVAEERTGVCQPY